MVEFFVLIWIVSIIIGVVVGNQKGEGCISFAMTFLLGPIWLPVVFISRGNRRQCPHCKESIHKDAEICPHCKSNLKVEQTGSTPLKRKDYTVEAITKEKQKTNRLILLTVSAALILALLITYFMNN